LPGAWTDEESPDTEVETLSETEEAKPEWQPPKKKERERNTKLIPLFFIFFTSILHYNDKIEENKGTFSIKWNK